MTRSLTRGLSLAADNYGMESKVGFIHV